MVVVALPADLVASAGLDPARVPLVVAGASLVQAGCMALAGQLSTRTGRRRFFVGWGVCAAVAGPLTWLTLMGRTDRALGAVVLLAGLLQAVTVAGYGPVGAYLAEGFPAAIRSTGYGTAYSLSIVLPALHPFYLPGLSEAVGHRAAVTGLMVLGGSLVAAAGAAGPRVGRRERDATLEALQPATADAGAGRAATCGASAPTRSSARSGRARRAASRARSDRA